ncbi:MAG: RagB/SusD family nutrient uptake outer membrane protein [Paludibacter sp.]
MKKIINYILLLSIIGTLVSCNDYLQTKSNSTFTESTAFVNLDFATKNVNAIYNQFTGIYMYDFILMFTKCDNDIEVIFTTGDDGSVANMAHYSATPGNLYIKEMWNTFYKSIEMSNIAIDNLPQSPIWTGEYAAAAHQLYGEAVTLRAMNYFELMSLWGDVPFKTKETQAGDNFNLPKTDRDSIYEFLIKDLASVEDYIPWMTETHNAERVNKGFVKGLRARMALAYAGYSLRNKTFETRRGRYWQDYYKIANTECKEIMESGKHKLNPNFTNIFKNLHTYSQDLTYNEDLFEIAFGRLYSGRLGYSFGMLFSTSPPDPKYGKCGGSVHVPCSYFYTFDKLDTRRNVSAELYSYKDPSKLSKQTLNAPYDMTATKFRRSWIIPSMGGDLKNAVYTGVNFPIMRYSDILLMYAETENEINNGPTAAAKEALTQVRQRAFTSDMWAAKVTNYIDSVSLNKDGFFNAIVNERAWEFGGEMLRKQDLVRWNILGSKLAEMQQASHDIIFDVRKDVPNYIYWKYKDDGETLDILNPDYRIPGTQQVGWNASYMWGWAKTPGYYSTVMEQIAHGYDPSKNNHLYPIASDIINTSNGVLINDQIP